MRIAFAFFNLLHNSKCVHLAFDAFSCNLEVYLCLFQNCQKGHKGKTLHRTDCLHQKSLDKSVSLPCLSLHPNLLFRVLRVISLSLECSWINSWTVQLLQMIPWRCTLLWMYTGTRLEIPRSLSVFSPASSRSSTLSLSMTTAPSMCTASLARSPVACALISSSWMKIVSQPEIPATHATGYKFSFKGFLFISWLFSW